MLNRRLALAPLAAAAALLAVSCGSKSDEPEVALTIPGGSTTLSAPEASPSTSTALNCDPATVTPPDPSAKPTVTVPDGAAPTELVSTDLVVGTGAEAKAGDTVQVEYVVVLYDGGTQFDASWDRGAEPFEFELGAGMVIQGWDEGVQGMKVGGQRQLVIPADLAYGEQGAGADIPPNATLVFVVDLLQVCSPEAADAATTGSTAGADGADPTAATDATGETTTTVAADAPSTTVAN